MLCRMRFVTMQCCMLASLVRAQCHCTFTPVHQGTFFCLYPVSSLACTTSNDESIFFFNTVYPCLKILLRVFTL